MQVLKRLIPYAARYRAVFALALVLLSVSVATELAGPLIAKRVIDIHVLGIEKRWFEAPEASGSVTFSGRSFEREDRLRSGIEYGSEVRVLQVGRQFVFVPEPVSFDGKRSLENGKLVITREDRSAEYEARVLSAKDLFAFFRPEIGGMLRWMGVYIALLIVSAVFQYGQVYSLQTAANKVIRDIRVDAYRQIHRLPVRFFDHLPAGKIVSRVTNDTEAVKELFVRVLSQFFTGSVYIAGIFVALFLLDVCLALICLILIPVLFLWIWIYRKFASTYNRAIQSRLSELNGRINETIQGIPVIRAFRRQRDAEAEFETVNGQYLAYQNKLLHLNSLTSYNLVNVLRNLSLAVLIWYFAGSSWGVESVITLGTLYAFVDYLGRLFQPVTDIVNQLGQLDLALVSAERAFRLMDEPGEDMDEGHCPRFRGHVVFDRVSFAYKGEDYVLKNISFEAKPGQTIALVGHTGSGKSSIMNLLFRFYDPQKGRILIDGRSISELPRQQLRRHMGIVLQDPFLFTGTIAENVSLNDPSVSRERVEEALKAVGADKAFATLADGYDAKVLEKGSTLSAGQRQLISFARALAFDPAILVLDEATSNIDSETEHWIDQALKAVKKNRTTLVIAHRLSTIRDADEILVLHQGEVVERGTHEELMRRKGRYYAMYQIQSGEAQMLT